MKEGGLFWPVFLIFVGTVILLVNLGILPEQTWRYWPLILIIPGLLKLSGIVDSDDSKKK
jgi:hypothetical protein